MVEAGLQEWQDLGRIGEPITLLVQTKLNWTLTFSAESWHSALKYFKSVFKTIFHVFNSEEFSFLNASTYSGEKNFI